MSSPWWINLPASWKHPWWGKGNRRGATINTPIVRPRQPGRRILPNLPREEGSWTCRAHCSAGYLLEAVSLAFLFLPDELQVMPEFGGQTTIEPRLVRGAPDAGSSSKWRRRPRYIDLGPKLADYEQAGVRGVFSSVRSRSPTRSSGTTSRWWFAGSSTAGWGRALSLGVLAGPLARPAGLGSGRHPATEGGRRPRAGHARACRTRRRADRTRRYGLRSFPRSD